VGDFSSGTPLYLGHFKSSSANNAYVLIEADDDPRIAGVLFKTEDTDTDVRIKGALFFDNSASDAYGRGILKLAINNSASNTNVTVSDVVLGIAATQITAYQNFSMNGNELDMASGSISNVDVINANTLNAAEKNFDIPHPTKEGWRLRYSVLEGPERGVYVRGKVQGDGIINLPDYWSGLIYEDSITVDLTPIGKACTHYVKDANSSKIEVGCGCGDVNAYYVVFAERKASEPVWVEYQVVQ